MRKKRILSFILSICLLVSMLPVQVFATESDDATEPTEETTDTTQTVDPSQELTNTIV